MNVLVIGEGARESAFIWKIKQSPRLKRLFVAPGNYGMKEMAEIVPINCSSMSDIEELVQFAKEYRIDITIVGPEKPLSLGIADEFQKAGLRIFGPSKRAAMIESSKLFAKELLSDLNIPTASFHAFSDYTDALEHLHTRRYPVVIKADGLARGRGVHICMDKKEGMNSLRSIMIDKIHGHAGETVVMEDYLEGEEISIHAICDGKSVSFLPSVRDYKKALDGNAGQNTGGMGAYGPIGFEDGHNKFLHEAHLLIFNPVLKELERRGKTFIGCLYAGLIITQNGMKVLEFNARFGDPEAQIIMLLLKSDLLDIIDACLDGELSHIDCFESSVVCVNLVSKGYPGKCETGFAINGHHKAEKIPGVIILPAAVGYKDQRLVNTEGRVFSVVGWGGTLEDARSRAYEAVECIHFEGMHYRKDIGLAPSYQGT
jgi:phosphoribosylamine---glycine ligase